jgi:hypothetical protein
MSGLTLSHSLRSVRVAIASGIASMSAASAAVGAGMGGAAMYCMDPVCGRRRRHLLRDRIVHFVHLAHRIPRRAIGRAKNVRNHLRGVCASIKDIVTFDLTVPDATLKARIHASTGHVLRDPYQLDITVTNGMVTLAGRMSPEDSTRTMECVAVIPGVLHVTNCLGGSADATLSVPENPVARAFPVTAKPAHTPALAA